MRSILLVVSGIIRLNVMCRSQELNLNSTDFYGLFYCCAVVPLSQVRGRVERSLTGLTPPHTLCACPKPGTCNPEVVVVFFIVNFNLVFVF